MTPKEKAAELVAKFLEHAEIRLNDDSVFSKLPEAKQCAFIVVNEILSELKIWGAPFLFEETSANDWANSRLNTYWQQVKTEIEAL